MVCDTVTASKQNACAHTTDWPSLLIVMQTVHAHPTQRPSTPVFYAYPQLMYAVLAPRLNMIPPWHVYANMPRNARQPDTCTCNMYSYIQWEPTDKFTICEIPAHTQRHRTHQASPGTHITTNPLRSGHHMVTTANAQGLDNRPMHFVFSVCASFENTLYNSTVGESFWVSAQTKSVAACCAMQSRTNHQQRQSPTAHCLSAHSGHIVLLEVTNATSVFCHVLCSGRQRCVISAFIWAGSCKLTM